MRWYLWGGLDNFLLLAIVVVVDYAGGIAGFLVVAYMKLKCSSGLYPGTDAVSFSSPVCFFAATRFCVLYVFRLKCVVQVIRLLLTVFLLTSCIVLTKMGRSYIFLSSPSRYHRSFKRPSVDSPSAVPASIGRHSMNTQLTCAKPISNQTALSWSSLYCFSSFLGLFSAICLR